MAEHVEVVEHVESDGATAPKGRRRRGGFLKYVGAGVVGAVIGAPLAAYAWSPVFDDVGYTHPFRTEIEWMNATGISTGYPGTGPVGRDFKPTANVTRQAMARFLQAQWNVQEETDYAYSDAPFGTSSGNYVDLPGSTVTVSVPPGTSGSIDARFSGESTCSGGTGNDWCTIEILVDPLSTVAEDWYPLDPSDDFAFDSTNGGAEGTGSWSAHSIDRLETYVGPGLYTVKVQVATTEDGVTLFTLDDWALVVETELNRTDAVIF